MFEYKNITKKINLDKNDGLSSYLNHAAQQNHNAFEVFYNLLIDVKPKRILEIGTALGGFTDFLKIVSDENNLNISILSYDIYMMRWYKDMINKGIDVRVENIFNNDYTDIKDEVKDFIMSDGITLILCDGGDKKREFNILSNFMKVGDIIMGHDYAENVEYFETNIKGKVWNWLELQKSDIIMACKRNNLIEYNKEVFSSVVWASYIKI